MFCVSSFRLSRTILRTSPFNKTMRTTKFRHNTRIQSKCLHIVCLVIMNEILYPPTDLFTFPTVWTMAFACLFKATTTTVRSLLHRPFASQFSTACKLIKVHTSMPSTSQKAASRTWNATDPHRAIRQLRKWPTTSPSISRSSKSMDPYGICSLSPAGLTPPRWLWLYFAPS